MPLTQEQVLQYVQANGPCVPNDVRQALKAPDNFIVGALLSELVGAGKLSITDMSLGTSKFYYDPAQPEVLEKVGHHLNEKDVRAFQLLKQEKIVRTTDLTPLLRLCMANIPDFSRPLKVRTEAGEEHFWYYYLLTAEQAFELAKQKFFGEPEPKQELPKEEPATSPITQPAEQPVTQRVEAPAAIKKEPKPRKPKAAVALPQQTAHAELPSEGFAHQVHEFFESKQISVLQIVSNKKTELDCIVAIPSAVGPLHFYCKAKAKKSSSEGDLAAALLDSQQHKLPLLYVAGGSLTKKAAELLSTQLKNVTVVQPWA